MNLIESSKSLAEVAKSNKNSKISAEADKNNVRKTERKNTGSYHKDNRLYFLRSIFNFIRVNLL